VKLPNSDRAVVDIIKLRDYCLSTEHRRGQHKARVFAAALGLKVENAEELQAVLLEAARIHEAILSEKDYYGQRYILDFTLTRGEREAVIRSSWIIRRGEDFPRLTSCYIL
jgi:hypothetical protein